MKILEVTFDCTIAMPGYSNVKPGIGRAIIDEANGETPEQAWTELNKRAQAWHRKEFPELYPPAQSEPWTNQPITAERQKIEFRRVDSIPVISKEKERLEIVIDNATVLDELLTIREQCLDNHLSIEWIKKFNELNNRRPTSFAEGLD